MAAMLIRSLASLIALSSFAGAAFAQAPQQVRPEGAENLQAPQIGAVSAADPRAQQAGMAMLRMGGNATDAALATMIALTVVEPQSSGIGGGGFFVRGAADGEVETIDGRETAPAGATPDWFLNPDGSLPDFHASVESGLSVGIPGNVELAWEAHKKFGKLPWPVLFGPAIELARKGFAVNGRLYKSLTDSAEFVAKSDEAKAWLLQPDGTPKPVGTLVKNEALADTLDAIASGGPQAFYGGAVAGAIVSKVASAMPKPGAMTESDLAAYQAKMRDAVCGSYRGYRLCGMGPPTSGGVAVLQILGMLERFDLKRMGIDNPETWHLFLEAQRLAYADRELYLADTDFVQVPVSGLIDANYLAKRSALIKSDTSLAVAKAGTPSGASQALADGDEGPEHGTSHLAAVDAEGTMVSYTTTIESAFGSGMMAKGFFLNNELTDFSRSPSIDGKPVANRVEGGKRPRSSMSPFVVWDAEGRPVLAIGAAGGSTIPVQTARSIIGVIDFGLPPEEALGLPFLMAFGNQVMVEKGTWLEQAIPAFKALGHTQIVAREAPVKGGAVGLVGSEWQSARDPRLGDSVATVVPDGERGASLP